MKTHHIYRTPRGNSIDLRAVLENLTDALDHLIDAVNSPTGVNAASLQGAVDAHAEARRLTHA